MEIMWKVTKVDARIFFVQKSSNLMAQGCPKAGSELVLTVGLSEVIFCETMGLGSCQDSPPLHLGAQKWKKQP